jgi:hypothetical protein
MFGIKPSSEWLKKMKSESENYSKGKSVTKKFEGDSEDKEERATASIQKYATSIMQDTYVEMLKISEQALKSIDPNIFDKYKHGKEEIDWKEFKDIPTESANRMALSTLDGVGVEGESTHFSKHILPETFVFKEKKMQAQNRNEVKVDDLRIDYTQYEIRHSKYQEQIEYVPWAPFSNSHKSKPFDKVKCPPFPEKGYPKTYELKQMFENWNTDNTEIPKFHYDSLCHFDYSNDTELQYAYNYREEDVPFVVYNYPVLDNVMQKWQDLDYIHGKLGTRKYHTETSESNHFMYWRGGGGGTSLRSGKKWKPPTGSTSVTFDQWLETAVKGQNISLEEREHQYFRVSSDSPGNEWLYDELPFFAKGRRR